MGIIVKETKITQAQDCPVMYIKLYYKQYMRQK